MNESSFITFDTYMLRQNGTRFYEGLYVTFKLAPDLKKNTVYFLPLFDRPKINIVFSNTLKARSCIANQVHNSKTTL